MASKLFYIMFLALATHFSTLSVDGAQPVIDIVSAVSDKNAPHMHIRVKIGGGILKGSTELGVGQVYKLKTDVNGVYYASVLYGLKFASFHAYEPARDKGKSTIYWRANDSGFDISYDKTHWKQVAPWQSE